MERDGCLRSLVEQCLLALASLGSLHPRLGLGPCQQLHSGHPFAQQSLSTRDGDSRGVLLTDSVRGNQGTGW